MSDTESATEATTVDNTEVVDIQSATPDEDGDLRDEGAVDESADTFPRSYVERLRRESAGYRERAQAGDTYAQRLHTELVKATGKLADATDLTFDEAHLEDPDALAAAIDDLLARKPHLANRRPVGDIGQGPVSGAGSNVDLAAILRQRAQ